MDQVEVSFLPLQEQHISLLQGWFKEPHVAEFWQESEPDLKTLFLSKLPESGVTPYIIAAGQKPIGYIQSYEACKVGGGWWPDAKEGTFGIDQFIGDPNYIGKGFGTEILKKFTHHLFSKMQASEIITDPDPKNERAIRAYEKAGFETVGPTQTPDGEALLMRLKRPLMLNPMETFLREFHKKHPSCTPASFLTGFTEDKKTSYDVVASVIEKNQSVILDLACGDGILLERLSRSRFKHSKLIGVDMSRGELDVAQTRLANRGVQLFEGRAQKIPLADKSVDFVLCHMAFMLMDSIEEVVSEIYRILKQGGTFSAVVGGGYKETLAMKTFLSLLDAALKDEGKTWLKDLGDKRTRSEAGLRSLFFKSEFLQPGVVNEFTIQFHDLPENLMSFFMLMYDVGLLTPERQSLLGEALLSKFKTMTDSEGKLSHSLPLRHVVFCRR